MRELPKRQETDGPIAMSRPDEGRITINVTSNGEMQFITMSDYNAARILCSLCLFLQLPMPRALMKLGM